MPDRNTNTLESVSAEAKTFYDKTLLARLVPALVFAMLDTSPTAVTITVPGAITFSPLGYFCVIDKESLPVGTLMPNAIQKSLRALTAL